MLAHQQIIVDTMSNIINKQHSVIEQRTSEMHKLQTHMQALMLKISEIASECGIQMKENTPMIEILEKVKLKIHEMCNTRKQTLTQQQLP